MAKLQRHIQPARLWDGFLFFYVVFFFCDFFGGGEGELG